MGTDIHPAIEIRRRGVWRYHRPTTPCSWYTEVWEAGPLAAYKQDVERKASAGDNWAARALPEIRKIQPGDRKNTWDRCKYRLPEFFRDRNYLLFAILADVRNDYGLISPIAPDRGVPDDISPEAKAQLSSEHSPTWVTLAEILAGVGDGSAPVQFEGIIDEAEFLRCVIKRDDPEAWSGGVFGNDIVTLDPDQYLALFGTKSSAYSLGVDRRTRTYDPTKRYEIRYQWERPIGFACPQILEWIGYLKPLVPRGGTADDVRVVMDFDS